MFGENADHCWTCGRMYITGCVLGGECPDCESKRTTLERSGWKLVKAGLFGTVEGQWEDPKFPGTVLPQGEALRIQEGRDIEALK